jgi:hypothetical protein
LRDDIFLLPLVLEPFLSLAHHPLQTSQLFLLQIPVMLLHGLFDPLMVALVVADPLVDLLLFLLLGPEHPSIYALKIADDRVS